MARVCTLKDWLEAFYRKQEDDLHFFADLLTSPKISEETSRELNRRLQERRQFSFFFKTLSWHNLSLDELEWCKKKMEEILSRENEIREILDRLLEMFGSNLIKRPQ